MIRFSNDKYFSINLTYSGHKTRAIFVRGPITQLVPTKLGSCFCEGDGVLQKNIVSDLGKGMQQVLSWLYISVRWAVWIWLLIEEEDLQLKSSQQKLQMTVVVWEEPSMSRRVNHHHIWNQELLQLVEMCDRRYVLVWILWIFLSACNQIGSKQGKEQCLQVE